MKHSYRILLLALSGASSIDPVPANRLASSLNIRPRQLRLLIAEMRRSGYLIGSSASGYYLCQTGAEIREMNNRLRKHALAELAVLKPFRLALRNETQIEIMI